jgi:CRP-like cAMP-binding protein
MIKTDIQTLLATTVDADIFTGVDQKNLEKILSNQDVKHITMKKGQYIYHHGDKAEKFWIIISGEIVAQVHSLRHPFHSLRYYPGDITGLRGIVDPGKPRPVSMITDSEVELIEIPAAVIMAMDADVWGHVMANISKMLLDRLLECHNRLDH